MQDDTPDAVAWTRALDMLRSEPWLLWPAAMTCWCKIEGSTCSKGGRLGCIALRCSC